MPTKVSRRKLAAVLDGAAAGALHASLLAGRGKPITLDASGVERLSVPAIQVLLSAAMTWAGDGVALRLVKPSPAFLEGLAGLSVPASALQLQEAN